MDIGVKCAVTGENILPRKVAHGTRNMTKGPAMTREETVKALEVGIDLMQDLKQQGYRIVATGEMGIGNTTTSSAVASVLLGLPPEEATGRGAGLSSEGLARKRLAVRRAIACNAPDPSDAFDVLQKVGGLDLAGMAGAFLGGAAMQMPVVIDGFISAGGRFACRPHVSCSGGLYACLPCIRGAGGPPAFAGAGVNPLLTANMTLGEGTGAVAALPLLDMACAVYGTMRTFEQISIEPYQPLH